MVSNMLVKEKVQALLCFLSRHLSTKIWYRMLSRPYAFTCVLRLRTSTKFKPGHSCRLHFSTLLLCPLRNSRV
ncbi:hypothetical protein ERO13_D11G083850v2 [Gossypium hirsutum]|nr:hypothetical protein ERO13_D11G083850v2 [Gossypium hirsutum]KAG4119487.1 hypothetical protein ERO13_D11G083850v2 [Gossypium hirsutum]